MFNKKKKHFHHNQKPHYTRQDQQPGNGQGQTPPAGDGNNPGQDQANAAAPAPGNAQAQPVKDDVVIYPFKSKSNPRPADPFPKRHPANPPAAAPSEPFQSLNPNIDPNDVPNPEGQPVKICQICNMPIRSVNTSVRHKVSKEPVHFDCALRELSKEFNSKLGRFKKIYYIGAGNFAVVKEIFDRRGHLKSYEVLERIPYEEKEK